MSVIARRVSLVLAVALVVIVAANVPTVRDALAVLIVVGLVILFFGIRLIAYR